MAFSDPLEAAQEAEQRFREQALKAVKDTSPPPLRPTLRCYNCDEPVESGRLFCDADCRDDYTARERSRACPV